MANLIMEIPWPSDILEFGVINVTSFRMSKETTPQKTPLHFQSDPDKTIANILAHDAVSILKTAFQKLIDHKSGSFKYSPFAPSNCGEKGEKWVHGSQVIKLFRETIIDDPLSGRIQFDESGRRINVSLDILEMAPNGNSVKIGTWSDLYGLSIESEKPFSHRGFLPGRKAVKYVLILTIPPIDLIHAHFHLQEQSVRNDNNFRRALHDVKKRIRTERK